MQTPQELHLIFSTYFALYCILFVKHKYLSRYLIQNEVCYDYRTTKECRKKFNSNNKLANMNKNIIMTTCLSCLAFSITLQANADTHKEVYGYFSNSDNADAEEIFDKNNYSEVYYMCINIQTGKDKDHPTIITNNTNVITNTVEMMNVSSSCTGNIELINNGIIRDFSDEDPYENTILKDLDIFGQETTTPLVTDASMLKLIATGSFTNNGILGLDIYMNNGGTVTLNDGSSMAGVSASKGVINVNGAIGAEGTFTLGENLVMNFSKDSFIDLKGNMLTANEAISINMHESEYEEGKELILFKNVAEGSTTEFDVNIIDDSGTVLKTVKGGVGSNIPEPASATLSVLALAALSARRRRS